MKNDYFREVKTYAYPHSPLLQPEIDALITLASNTCKQAMANITKGSCLVFGQSYDKHAQRILQFTMPKGDGRGRLSSGKRKNCSEIVEESINQAISYLAQQSEPVKGFISLDEADEHCLVLVLNADHGRFLISACLEDDSTKSTFTDKYSKALMVTIARSLTCIHPEDSLLDKAVHYLANGDIAVMRCLNYVVMNFTPQPRETMTEWGKWYESLSAENKILRFN